MKHPIKSRIAWLALAAAVVAAVGGTWYLNRKQCDVAGEYWGEICIGYRWGRAVTMTVDRDLDGLLEARSRYSGELGADPRFTHATPEESWEDWDRDGRFERHYVYSADGIVLRLDTNGDGSYDKELRGPAAIQYMKEHPWPDA